MNTGSNRVGLPFIPRFVTDVLRSLGDEAEVEVRVIDAKNAVRIDAGPGFGAMLAPLTQEK